LRMPGQNLRAGLRVQGGGRTLHVVAQLCAIQTLAALKLRQTAMNGGPKRTIRQVRVGAMPVVEGGDSALDLARHGEIPDGHLPETIVHVDDERLRQRSSQLAALVALPLQAMQHQSEVHEDHLESAFAGVGYTPLIVKDGLPGLRHNRAIKLACSPLPVSSILKPGKHLGALLCRGWYEAGPYLRYQVWVREIAIRLCWVLIRRGKTILMCRRSEPGPERNLGGAKPNAEARSLRALSIAALFALVLTACSETVTKHGFHFHDNDLQQVRPGMSQEEVKTTLGTPTTTATVGGGTAYYYIGSTEGQKSFLKPVEKDRKVLAIYFSQLGSVERVAQYGLKDGKVFDYVKQETPHHARDESMLKALFRNLGTKQLGLD